MASTRAYLAPHEQEAIAREIDELVRLHVTQTAVASLLGLSQAAISKASRQRVAGPDVARRVERHQQTTVAELVSKYGVAPPPDAAALSPLDIAIAYLGDAIGSEAVRRVRQRAGARDMSPSDWGQELLAEQQSILEERARPVPSPSPPGSVRRKRM